MLFDTSYIHDVHRYSISKYHPRRLHRRYQEQEYPRPFLLYHYRIGRFPDLGLELGGKSARLAFIIAIAINFKAPLSNRVSHGKHLYCVLLIHIQSGQHLPSLVNIRSLSPHQTSLMPSTRALIRSNRQHRQRGALHLGSRCPFQRLENDTQRSRFPVTD